MNSRQRRGLLALVGVSLLAAGTAAGFGSCSSQHGVLASHGIETPLGVSGSRSAEGVETTAQEEAPLRLESFSPILLQSGLESVQQAMNEGDATEAALAFSSWLASDAERARLPEHQLLLGRLRDAAGQSRPAIDAYARSAEVPWVLQDYAHYYAGRAALGAGDPRLALTHLDQVDSTLPVPVRLHRGEAAGLVGENDRAVQELRAFLGSAEHPDGWVRASMLLARLLIERRAATGAQPVLDDRLEALHLLRRVSSEAAGTESAKQAVELIHRVLAELPPAEFERQRRLPVAEQLVRLQALADKRRWDDVLVAADELLGGLPRAERFSDAGCEARVLRNKALAGTRQWGRAVDAFDEVIAHCSGEDLRARALYLAGRYAMSDKRYSKATRLYAQLEREAPSHRLADDARLLGAEAFLELGDASRFTSMLSSIAEDYPEGDVALDGTFALALGRIEKRDWAGAANVLERGMAVARRADAARDHETAGRERYFRARAWIETGEQARGLDEYAALIRDCPLSYYMQHAYSRLLVADPQRAHRELDAAMLATQAQAFSFEWRPEFEQPAFKRALALLRVGEVDAAATEIETLGAVVEDAAPELLWAVALLYDRAGSANLAQKVLRGHLTDWLRRWPAGDWRKAWELAFPRPYHPIVQKEAERNGLPEELIYAVMREESVFDPRAVSHADAFGLMQLIEPTAKHFSKQLGLPYRRAALLNPSVNIALGAKVLSTYSAKFPNDPLLGIPGYNAGPGRPKRWRRERPQLDFDAWVEFIPFRETRRYTKRVLASRGAYAVLYGGPDASWTLPLTFTEPAQ